jgi:hemerythrin-like domain-containing protein
MKLTDELAHEHTLIEAVAGALRTYVRRRIEGTAPPSDGPCFVRFFRTHVGGWHHEREERALFSALTAELGLPADRGPVHALTEQHHDLAASLDALERLLVAAPEVDADEAVLEEAATSYAHALFRHLDAENSVLFPHSSERLRRGGVREIPWRDPTVEELEARDDGERLVREYPPVHDPVVMRGEGCVFCPSYGVTCQGIELTWWGEEEWGEFGDDLG